MKKPQDSTACFVAAYCIPELDTYLQKNGFHGGMILFAIPDYGIQFRCRAQGKLVDLEFAAYFALLKFIGKNLAGEKVKKIKVYSSNPEFIFAFTGNSKHMPPGSARFQLVREHSRTITTSVGYLPPDKNKAFIPAADCPLVPEPHKIRLMHEDKDLKKPSFKPWQKGIQL